MTNEELVDDWFRKATDSSGFAGADLAKQAVLSRMFTTEQLSAYCGLVEAARLVLTRRIDIGKETLVHTVSIEELSEALDKVMEVDKSV